MSDLPPIERPWDTGPKDTTPGTVDPVSGATWDGRNWVKDGLIWTGKEWLAPDVVARRAKVQNSWWQRGRNITLVVFGVFVAIIALVSVSVLNGSGSNSTRAADSDGDELGAWVVCQQEMSKRLRSPATAEYPSRREVRITQSDKTYSIRGWVDSQNGFGALVRTEFLCTAVATGGDNYRVSVSPQN
jgi:hypothetical protein